MADPALIGPMVDAKAKELWDLDHPDGPAWKRATPCDEQEPYIRLSVAVIARRREVGRNYG